MNKALIATLLASIAAMPARAAEIHILSAAAMQTVFANIAPAFEQAAGHRLVFTYTTMGAITERVLKGETADLVALGGSPLDDLDAFRDVRLVMRSGRVALQR